MSPFRKFRLTIQLSKDRIRVAADRCAMIAFIKDATGIKLITTIELSIVVGDSESFVLSIFGCIYPIISIQQLRLFK